MTVLTVDNIRHPRGRFSWVRRLMQGQRTNEFIRQQRIYNDTYYKTNNEDVHKIIISEPETSTARRRSSHRRERNFEDAHSEGDMESDLRSDGHSEMTSISDNISTTPLKSIASVPSTDPPSILSENNNDNQSLNASTAETSLTPSLSTTPFNLLFNRDRDSLPPPDRDSESIVTLASSTRRIRRRSLETNSSTVGIPPASIMERLSVQPTAYANSLTTASLNPDDINSYKDIESMSTTKST